MTLHKKLRTFQKTYRFKFSKECRELFDSGVKESLFVGKLPPAESIWETPCPGNAYLVSSYKRVNQVFGEDDVIASIAQGEEHDGRMHFWHCSFLRHAYPVAKTILGDPIVQIAQGKHKGQIYLTNHDAWFGAPLVVAKGDEAGIAECPDTQALMVEQKLESVVELKTNAWVSMMSSRDLDFMFRIAPSLQDFYRYLVRKQPRAKPRGPKRRS